LELDREKNQIIGLNGGGDGPGGDRLEKVNTRFGSRHHKKTVGTGQ